MVTLPPGWVKVYFPSPWPGDGHFPAAGLGDGDLPYLIALVGGGGDGHLVPLMWPGGADCHRAVLRVGNHRRVGGTGDRAAAVAGILLPTAGGGARIGVFAALLRPVGVKGGVLCKDCAGCDFRTAGFLREPPVKDIPVPGGGGQAGKLPVHGGGGSGRNSAAVGVKGDSHLRLRRAICDNDLHNVGAHRIGLAVGEGVGHRAAVIGDALRIRGRGVAGRSGPGDVLYMETTLIAGKPPVAEGAAVCDGRLHRQGLRRAPHLIGGALRLGSDGGLLGIGRAIILGQQGQGVTGAARAISECFAACALPYQAGKADGLGSTEGKILAVDLDPVAGIGGDHQG